MKTDRNSTFGRTTRKKLDNYLSSSPKWKEFCQGKEVIKEFIASFDTEDDQVALEHWYNHYVYPDDSNCWSRKTSTSGVISEKVRKTQRKRVEAGTHNFSGPEMNRKRVENGTHPFLGGEIQRRRVEAGTHPFLGGEISRRTNRKRIEEGTHNLLGTVNALNIETGEVHNISTELYHSRRDIYFHPTSKVYKEWKSK